MRLFAMMQADQLERLHKHIFGCLNENRNVLLRQWICAHRQGQRPNNAHDAIDFWWKIESVSLRFCTFAFGFVSTIGVRTKHWTQKHTGWYVRCRSPRNLKHNFITNMRVSIKIFWHIYKINAKRHKLTTNSQQWNKLVRKIITVQIFYHSIYEQQISPDK